MKRNWKSKLAAALLIGTVIFAASCNRESKEDEQVHQHETAYTCPMHPQIVQQEPGACPICGMDLVPLSNGAGGDSTVLSGDLRDLLRPVSSTIVANIHTVTPQKKQLPVSATASGMITYDTRRSYTIPVRFGGRIERLYVNYNFEPVRKGQKILEIYSPEIVTAQNELLYLLESDPENHALIEASRQKLRLLGLTGAQIERLIRTGEASYSLAIHSPYDGYIYEESAASPALQAAQPQTQAPGGMNSMSGNEMQAAPPAGAVPAETQLSIREGMYLSKGQTTFKVINADRVWAEFNIYPDAAPYIKKGDEVTIVPDFNRDMPLKAKVDLVQPFYGNGENFSKVRVYLDNPESRFRPGQLVTAQFQSQSDTTWWIPSAAVLDLGTKRVVFTKEGPVFHPRVIRTGRLSGDWAEVVSGLSAADTIARDGHYMVDSEGFVKIENKDETQH